MENKKKGKGKILERLIESCLVEINERKNKKSEDKQR